MDTYRAVLIAAPWVIMLCGFMLALLLYRMPNYELSLREKWKAFELLVCISYFIAFLVMGALQINLYREYLNIHGAMLMTALFLGAFVVWRAERFPSPAE